MNSIRFSLLTAFLALSLGVSAATAADPAERVRRAALVTYVHGMTDEIAAREVGLEGIPHLLALLRDPSFPRRDNVVAFLAHLAGDEATPALLAHLERPVAPTDTPEEDRALLLVPQALGRIAARGGQAARAALLEMNASPDLRSDLARQARYGLALSGERRGPDDGTPIDAFVGRAAGDETAVRTIDPSSTGHVSGLSYANHIDLADPMTNAQLDSNLEFASIAAGQEDFADDMACCIGVRRSGNARTFGQPGDGLDVIDSYETLHDVGDVAVARVKVVSLINYCGGPGTNIVGCATRPGDWMIVVRLSSNEGLLWLHEYGHNTGLPHNADSRYVMHARLSSGARALTFSDCASYHAPHSDAQITPAAVGVCHDDDSDGFVAAADNCPDDANPGQADSDGDGQGDVCEGCVDLDGDGYGFPAEPDCPHGLVEDCDDSNDEVNPAAMEICDGQDNDCNGGVDDLTCDLFEATGDSSVDGVEVTWLAWAFGTCSAPPHNEWWLPIDYSGDGCVDGDDLAILATAYRCSGIEAVCE